MWLLHGPVWHALAVSKTSDPQVFTCKEEHLMADPGHCLPVQDPVGSAPSSGPKTKW